MQRIDGAGILLIEMYKNTNCFVFFRSRNGEYNDTGGIRDAGEMPKTTACRECREETANLLQFSVDDLSVNIIVNKYISYPVYIEGLHLVDYLKNIKITHRNCSHHWKETSHMARIPIAQVSTGRLPHVKDFYGRDIILRGRTCKIITNGMNTINKILNTSPIKLHRQTVNTASPKTRCLIGTTTYTVPTKFTTTASTNHRGTSSAIYIKPDVSKGNNDVFIAITGFSKSQPDASNIKFHSSKHWRPNKKNIMVVNNNILLKSKTLDALAKYLHKLGYHKINNVWHVVMNTFAISNATWSIYCVEKSANKISWTKISQL